MNPSLLAHVEAAYDGRDEAIAVLDESLRVRAWSAAMGALSGRPPEAVRGVLLYDLYPQLWGTKTAQLLTDALHGEYGHIAEPFFAAATPAQAHAAEAFVAPLLAGGRVSGVCCAPAIDPG
ncbi:MAG: PAS domain-containing protein, partial [Polyangiaceae bacterium]